MWIYYNTNPMGKQVGDCVIRAITKALNISWVEAYLNVCIQGLLMGDMPSNNAVWGAFLQKRGFRKKLFFGNYPDNYSVADFCQDHPEGVFVVAVHNHVLTVVDGDYYDSWQSENENPIYFFEREE